MELKFYLIVLHACFCIYCQDIGWKKGKQFHGYKLPNWVSNVPMPWESTIKCIVTCSRSPICTGLFYNELDEQCLHFFEDHFEFWVGDPDDAIIFFAPMNVVMVTNGPVPAFDFNAAGDICSTLRGRLITNNEMYTLWNNGLEMCRTLSGLMRSYSPNLSRIQALGMGENTSICGWIQDGTNVMPQQSICEGSPQLKNCGAPLAHAFCMLN